MSFDRYVAIVHPVSATWRKLRTHGNAVLITLGVRMCLFDIDFCFIHVFLIQCSALDLLPTRFI